MTDAHMTLPEFFAHVDDVKADRLARGVRKVYFQHDTLTPLNVRATWDDIPLAEVPKVGDVLDLPGFGYDGADGRWRVAKVAENGTTSYVVTMTDLEAS